MPLLKQLASWAEVCLGDKQKEALG
jgi:hypothetical protein